MNARAILEFTNNLTDVCKNKKPGCPTCCYRLFCYTTPLSWTEGMVANVISYLEQDMVSHTGTEDRIC